MQHSEMVRILYKGILGREPDRDGLLHHCDLLEKGATMESVAASIDASSEAQQYRRRSAWRDRMRSAASRVSDRLEDLLVILDIGAQELEFESHCYQRLIDQNLVQTIIGFDPIEEKARDRNAKEPIADIRPIALGTGKEETLYVNNYDATSSLYPINDEIMGATEDLYRYYTVRKISLPTTRLDDVITPHRIDFMKLDIQGYELRVLEHAIETLQKTLCIHVETEFQQIYQGQPLFGEIFNFLISEGFTFCELTKPMRLSSRRFRECFPHLPASRLFWGDAVFLKSEVEAPDDLLRQALITNLVYEWPDETYDLLRKYDSRTGAEAAIEYAASLSNPDEGRTIHEQ